MSADNLNLVACAYCRKDIVLGVDNPDTLVDLPVHKNGKLAYIEIAHKVCVPAKGPHVDSIETIETDSHGVTTLVTKQHVRLSFDAESAILLLSHLLDATDTRVKLNGSGSITSAVVHGVSTRTNR